MAAVLNRCLVLLFFVYSIRDSSSDSAEEKITDYMDEQCYWTIDFGQYDISERLMKLSRSNVYSANSTCFIEYRAKAGYRLMFKFLSIDMDTCNDFMGIYGDSLTAPDAVNVFVCSQPQTVFTTPSRTGILLFVSDGQGNAGEASVLVSMFKTKSGSCGDKHFNCDNNRCVPDALKCNTRDNCGNNHDEEEGCRWWLGLAIGLSVMGVFGIGTLVFFIIFLMKYSGRKKVQSQPVQSWTLTPPQQGWAHTHVSSRSGDQQQMQHVSQSYTAKTGNTTQYWDMGRGHGQQSTFVSSTFSEPPTYTETAPAPADYTLPAGSVTTPPPVPVLPASTTGVVTSSHTGTYGPHNM